MAEILMCPTDKVNPNLTAAQNRRSMLKRGNASVVMEDGHEWSRRELDINRFIIVKVPGPRADYEHLLDEDVLVDTNGDPVLDDDGDEIPFRRARYIFDLNNVPQDQRGKQTIVLAKAQFQPIDKRVPPL